jgi:hypothetical protein
MMLFHQRQLREAVEHAAAGGQALHMMDGSVAYLQRRTPNCFKGRSEIAHLFDQDKTRLVATARKLGVRKILVEREDHPYQHVDLCGWPLMRAKSAATKA